MSLINPFRQLKTILFVSLAFLLLAAPIPSKSAGISGTYVSKITTDSGTYAFSKRRHRSIVVELVQEGNEITGYADSVDMKITGKLEGDTITFFTWPNDITTTEIKGKWKVNPDGDTMQGTWSYPFAAGKWDLAREGSAAQIELNIGSATPQAIAAAAVSRLPPPVKLLSEFAQFELETMTVSETIKANKGKMNKALELEKRLKSKILPLLEDWNAVESENAKGKLLVKPHLTKLRVISGGSRFWLGATIGKSFIFMELQIVDASSGEEIARVLIQRNTDTVTGAYTIGSQDQEIIPQTASIAQAYLIRNYDDSGIYITSAQEQGAEIKSVTGEYVDNYNQTVKLQESDNRITGSTTYKWDHAVIRGTREYHLLQLELESAGQKGRGELTLTGDGSRLEGTIKMRDYAGQGGEWILTKLGQASNSVTDEEPGSEYNISGTYLSVLSKNLYNHFKRTEIEIKLVQSGNIITGTFVGAKGYIDGEIDGNTIKYEANPPYGNWTIGGKWVFSDEFNKATGDAGYHVTKGFWNLTRIE